MRIVLLGVAVAFATSGLADAGGPQSPWNTDYEKARTIARSAGKPMFVVFR